MLNIFGKSMTVLIITILVLSLGIWILTWENSRQAKLPFCYAHECTGKSPNGTNCASNPDDIKRLNPTKLILDINEAEKEIGEITLTHSEKCNANWAKWTLSKDGIEPNWEMIEISVWNDEDKDNHPDSTQYNKFQSISDDGTSGGKGDGWSYMIDGSKNAYLIQDWTCARVKVKYEEEIFSQTSCN